MDEDPVPRFELTIRFDPDGIEWTHFIGCMGHVRTPRELPAPLWQRLRPVVRALRGDDVRRFDVSASALPSAAPEDAHDALALAAWWMEWDRRRLVARGDSWMCPDCECEVRPRMGHCGEPSCASWDKLHLATGEPTLHVVPGTKSA